MAYFGFLFALAIHMAAPPVAGEDTHQPYVIVTQDGGERKERVGFWEERKEQSRRVVRVELDTPWSPGYEMISLSDLAEPPVKERPSLTAERLEKGWADAGFKLVNGKPVLIAQYELAQRARKMAGLDSEDGGKEPEPAEAGPVPAGAVATEPGEGPPLPGFFEQWSGHIGLVVVALLLTWLVVRMTFLAAD